MYVRTLRTRTCGCPLSVYLGACMRMRRRVVPATNDAAASARLRHGDEVNGVGGLVVLPDPFVARRKGHCHLVGVVLRPDVDRLSRAGTMRGTREDRSIKWLCFLHWACGPSWLLTVFSNSRRQFQ